MTAEVETNVSRMSRAELEAKLREIRMHPRAGNTPVYGRNLEAIMLAARGGYPKCMYHASEAPIYALTAEEELALSSYGFVTHYIPQSYPKMLFRRNMDQKFAHKESVVRAHEAVGGYIPPEFVEIVTVKSAEEEKLLRAKKQPATAGLWHERIDLIEPLPGEPEEDPAVTQARLEGQMTELREQLAKAQERRTVAVKG